MLPPHNPPPYLPSMTLRPPNELMENQLLLFDCCVGDKHLDFLCCLPSSPYFHPPISLLDHTLASLPVFVLSPIRQPLLLMPSPPFRVNVVGPYNKAPYYWN